MSTGETLTALFLEYAREHAGLNTSGASKWIWLKDLTATYGREFSSKNGSPWARNSRLSEYIVERDYDDTTGQLVGLRLAGFNPDAGSPAIRADIKRAIRRNACAVLAANENKVEVDHKSPWNSGTKEARETKTTETQREEHFQPLTRVVNMAKREHCNKCIASKVRFDARQLGYSIAHWAGTTKFEPKTQGCVGCYWHDPKRFNEEVSK